MEYYTENTDINFNDTIYAEFLRVYCELWFFYTDAINKLINNMKRCDDLKSKHKLKYEYFFSQNKKYLYKIQTKFYDKRKDYLKSLLSSEQNHKDQIYESFKKEILLEDFTFLLDPQSDFSKIQLFNITNKKAYYSKCYPNRSDDPGVFSNRIQKNAQDIIQSSKIIDIIENNHVLSPRLNVFLAIFNCYNSGQYEVALNLLVMQFEGIFDDYKLYANPKKYNESKDSLVPKVEHALLNTGWRLSYFMYYPYFAFEFNELRNYIAHKGKLNKNDYDDKLLTEELIVRINNILTLFGSSFNPYNNLKLFFECIDKDLEDGNPVPLSILYQICQLDKYYKIGKGEENSIVSLLANYKEDKQNLEFYTLEKDNESVTLYDRCHATMKEVETKEFWETIEKEINIFDHREEVNQFCEKFISYLTKKRCEGCESCKGLMKKLSSKQ